MKQSNLEKNKKLKKKAQEIHIDAETHIGKYINFIKI